MRLLLLFNICLILFYSNVYSIPLFPFIPIIGDILFISFFFILNIFSIVLSFIKRGIVIVLFILVILIFINIGFFYYFSNDLVELYKFILSLKFISHDIIFPLGKIFYYSLLLFVLYYFLNYFNFESLKNALIYLLVFLMIFYNLFFLKLNINLFNYFNIKNIIVKNMEGKNNKIKFISHTMRPSYYSFEIKLKTNLDTKYCRFSMSEYTKVGGNSSPLSYKGYHIYLGQEDWNYCLEKLENTF